MSDIFRFIFSRLSSLSNLQCVDFVAMYKQGYGIPEPRWTPEQMPDQTGRTVFITGGNDGIGKECVKALLAKNAKVYIACRNRLKSEEVIEELYLQTGKRARYVALDLGDLGSVKAAAEEFMSMETELNILINNAGVAALMNQNCNGYDTHIHVHVLGHFYLTKLLLPALLRTNKGGQRPRVIHLSSFLHYVARADGLDFATFKCGSARDKESTTEMYIQSKFANVVLSNEFARRYSSEGLVSIAVNPGNLKTSIAKDINRSQPFIGWILSSIMIHPASYGAITPLWAATAQETAEDNGKFLVPWAQVGIPHPATQDRHLGEALWGWLGEQLANKESTNQ